MAEEARGECPACSMPIPFGRTVKRRGEPFGCAACGTKLVLPKANLTLLMALVAAALLLAKLGGLLVLVIVVALIAIGDWKLAKTRIAEGGVEN